MGCNRLGMQSDARVPSSANQPRSLTSIRDGQLGNTGMFVSKLCLGTMTVGEATNGSMWPGGGIARLDEAGADAIVKRPVEAGINFIDTADV